MPTENISSIGSSGADYPTVAAWEAATDNNLVSSDTIEIGELQNEDHTVDNLRIQGATTDSTRYRILRAESGAEYDPVTDTGAKLVTSSGGNVLQVREAYFRLYYVGVDNNRNSTSATNCIRITGTGEDCFIDRCVFRMTGASTSGNNSAVVEQSSSNGDSRFWNSIAIGTGGSNGFRQGFKMQANFTRALHCAAYAIDQGGSTGDGFEVAGLNNRVRACASFDCSGSDVLKTTTPDSSSDYNATSDNSAPGGNSVINKTSTDFWVDPANDDFHLKADSPGINAGASAGRADLDGVDHNNDGDGVDIGPYNYDTLLTMVAEGDLDMSATSEICAKLCGDALGDLDMTASASACGDLSGVLVGPLDMTGVAEICARLSGDMSGVLDMTGTAEACGQLSGELLGDLDMTGSGVLCASLTGELGSFLVMTGRSAICATSGATGLQAVLDMLGELGLVDPSGGPSTGECIVYGILPLSKLMSRGQVTTVHPPFTPLSLSEEANA